MDPLRQTALASHRKALIGGALAGCALALLVALPAVASPDILVQIAEIPGESTRLGFEHAIDATGISMGVSAVVAEGSATSAGKLVFAPLTITKRADSTTPKLMEAAGSQRVLQGLQINLLRSGQDTVVKTVVTIPNAVVSDWRLVDVQGDALPVEQVTFRVDGFTVVHEDVDGTGKKTSTTGKVP